MHLRITWGRLTPGSWENFEHDYRRLVVDGEADVPGLRGRMLLRDNIDGDTGGTLSLWDSAEAAQAYEDGEVREQVLPHLKQHFAGNYISHICEVRVANGDLSISDG